MNKQSSDDSLVISYLTLRKTVGLLGTSLPFLLFFGALVLFGTGLQPSISSYYYTRMGNVFVGTLCVIGFFLFSYKGYERKDDIAGDLACIFALGVALFPAHATTDGADIIGYIHLGSAALFFGTLIYFSLFLFTKIDPKNVATRKKLQRNMVYKICGYLMGLCIILITIYYLLPNSAAKTFEAIKPVFWLEAVAIFAFGISWLTKGEAILGDEAEQPVKTVREYS